MARAPKRFPPEGQRSYRVLQQEQKDSIEAGLASLCVGMLHNDTSLSECPYNLLEPSRDHIRTRQRCQRPKPFSVTIK